MTNLPFLALKWMFTKPKLFALGFFPGFLTFLLASGLSYSLWAFWLSATTLWLSIPVMMITFLLSWLIFGNLSIIPVEDIIIDECQKMHWGEIRVKAPPFRTGRLFKEVLYSIFLGAMAILLFLLSFIPGINLINIIFAGWLSAYGFLATVYARKYERGSERLLRFFKTPISNLLLGLLLNVLLFIPVVNVFLLGYAQVLASLLYLKQEEKFKLAYKAVDE